MKQLGLLVLIYMSIAKASLFSSTDLYISSSKLVKKRKRKIKYFFFIKKLHFIL